MKRISIIILLLILIAPINSKAQNNGAAAAAAVVGGIVAIGAGIASMEEIKENAELKASQWILANHSEFSSFSLTTLDFDGKKSSDVSSASIISFKFQEFTPQDNPDLEKKYVLLAFTSYGWISEYGIDYNKVNWYLVDGKEWMNMMTAYTKVASKEKTETIIKDKLMKGIVDNRGIRVDSKIEIPFYKLEGDMYLVTDYSNEFKLVYNEKSLGIYIKKTGDLVQMSRSSLLDIHKYFCRCE